MLDGKYPDPNTVHPIPGVQRVAFLKNIINDPQVIIGDYTYYDDPKDVKNFVDNVLYHFPFMGDKLIIGKFCQIATGVRFIMNGSNHAMGGISTYPFKVFGGEWAIKDPMHVVSKGDTVVGNDVWIGNGVTIMQGIKIGDGAIIGTGSVVTKNVEPYTIVGGNPAREIRKRFNEEDIAFLLKLKWWDRDVKIITEWIELMADANFTELRKIYEQSEKKNELDLPRALADIHLVNERLTQCEVKELAENSSLHPPEARSYRPSYDAQQSAKKADEKSSTTVTVIEKAEAQLETSLKM